MLTSELPPAVTSTTVVLVPTSNWASTVSAPPTVTSTAVSKVVKFLLEIRILYVPGGRPCSVYCPMPPVRALRSDAVAVFVATTAAPGTTPPEAS